MIAVRDHLDQLGPASVVVVTFTARERLAAYAEHLAIPFPVLCDADRTFYRSYALGRGSWHRVYGLATLRAYLDLVRRGRRLRRPTEDTRQLGGDFVIDEVGRLAWQHHASGPDDRPPVAAIIDAVRATIR